MYSLQSDAPTKLYSSSKSTDAIDVRIVSVTQELVVFELINCDAAIANALRRIMLAEVETVAIETVAIEQNSSIIQDEVLAHRLGLVPLKIDPIRVEEGEVIKFKMEVTASEKFESVYSGALLWVPESEEQAEKFKGEEPSVVHDDILVAKLARGQEIVLEATCVAGEGKDHAKFSPVCTASYRTLPVVSINHKLLDETDHAELVDICPLGVFDLEDSVAVVKKPRNCTMCRECIRRKGWQEKVSLNKKSDHFIFSVESVGCIPAITIVKRAIAKLKAKCSKVKDALETM